VVSGSQSKRAGEEGGGKHIKHWVEAIM
jgi:hypothetical protein